MAQPEEAKIGQAEEQKQKSGEHNYPGKYSGVVEEVDDDPREIALKEKKTRANADRPPQEASVERKTQHVSFTTRLD
jgi:hypothetical protein